MIDQHEPLTYMDGSGQTTTTTYNSFGQIATITDPKGGVTTYNYDSNGYLLNIDGPLAGTNDKTTYTYDGCGRIYDPKGKARTYSEAREQNRSRNSGTSFVRHP